MEQEEQEMQEMGWNIANEANKSLWIYLSRAKENYSRGRMGKYFLNLNTLYKSITHKIERNEIEIFDKMVENILIKRVYWDAFKNINSDRPETTWNTEYFYPNLIPLDEIAKGKVEFCRLAEKFERELQDLLKKIGVL